MRPISVKNAWLFFPPFLRITSNQAYSIMDLRRSQPKPMPKTPWEEKGAPSAARDPKITEENGRTKLKTALKPIIVGRLSLLKKRKIPKLLTYKPPLKL
jgi:hypothetical protein